MPLHRSGLLLLAIGFFPGVLWATEYTLHSASELDAHTPQLRPGDVLTLASGEWKAASLHFRGKGLEGQPILLRAEVPGQVVLTGASRLVVEGEWLVVEGLAFKDGGPEGDGVVLRGQHNRLTATAMTGGTYHFFIRLQGADHRVDHCYLAGKTSAGPTLQVDVEASQPNRHRIDHNHFGPRQHLGTNGGETLRVGLGSQSTYTSRTLVESNLFERCNGEIEIISNKSCENTYRWNTFLACGGMLTLRQGNRCVVDGNSFLGHHAKDSGGIRVIGEDHLIVNNYIEGVVRVGLWVTSGVPSPPRPLYVRASRCLIAFNTIIEPDGPCLDLDNGFGDSGRVLRPEAITVANNLFSPKAGGPLFQGVEGKDWHWQGNLASGAQTDHPGVRTVGVPLAQDPAGWRRPAPNSPARGAAEGEFPAVQTDVEGQPRAGARDIGCDQVSDAPVLNHPLGSAEVGPAWLKR